MKHLLALIAFLTFSCVPLYVPQGMQLPVEAAFDDALAATQMVCPDTPINLITTSRVNAAAVLVLGKQRFLAYNRKAMRRIQERYGMDAIVAIFAHEIGHVCDSASGRPMAEETADIHAGCVLAIMGGDVDPVVAFLEAESVPSAVHGSAEERSHHFNAGYNTCFGLWR